MVISTGQLKRINSFELKRGSRRFPEEAREPAQSYSRHPIQLVEPTQREDHLPAGLRDSLCERLPWNLLARNEVSQDKTIKSYMASRDLLLKYEKEFDRFLAEVGQANLEFRQGSGETNLAARDQVLKAKLNSLLLTVSWPLIPNVDAYLASLPVAELHWRLEEALGNAVAAFTEQLFARLAMLVDRRIVGLVEWLPNNVCMYHYYKQVVIQDNLGASERLVNEVYYDVERRDPQTGRRVVGEATVEVVQGRGTHQHRLARHEHHVINAIRTTVKNSSVVFPLEVQHLLTKIPEWLYPFVEVIDGTIIGEWAIEQDLQNEPWQDKRREVTAIYGCEPGIIIGPYVLTGWGPREVEREKLRLTKETAELARQASVASARSQLPWLITASVFVSGLALYLTTLAQLDHQPHLMPILASCCAALAMWYTAWCYSIATGRANVSLFSWLTTMGCLGLLLTMQWAIFYFFTPISWLIPVGLLAMTLVSWRVAGWLETGS